MPTNKSSSKPVWIFTFSLIALVIVLIVFSQTKNDVTISHHGITNATNPSNIDSPFEYRIASKEEIMHTWGPQVSLDVVTTNQVAKNSTKNTLEEFWSHIFPQLGDRRVFIRIMTEVPGITPWATISRINTTGEWEVSIVIYEHGINAIP